MSFNIHHNCLYFVHVAPTLSRKVFDTTTQADQKINVYDNDENKYKRKSVTNWISNVLG